MVTSRKLRTMGLLCVALGLATLTAATVTAKPLTENYGPFSVTFYNNNDSDGFYQGQQNWTPTQRSDVAASIGAWSSNIQNTPGRQIRMHAFWYDFGPNSILGGSYSVTNGNGTTAWTYPEHVWRDSVNYNGPVTTFDTFILYDPDAAGYAWNFGSGAPAAGQIDFRSVVAHEIGHSLGFWPTYDPSDDTWGNTWGTSSNPFYFAGYKGLTAWDKHLKDSNGNRPANYSTGTPGNFNQTDNPVYWDGSYARAANGDQNVAIYAPTTYADGSSLSHLNYPTFYDALMSPFISLGASVRAPTALEWAMMRDMGWDVVPEPSVVVMFVGLAGVGLLFCYRRWRKR